MVTELGFVAYHASCLFGCVERPGVASGRVTERVVDISEQKTVFCSAYSENNNRRRPSCQSDDPLLSNSPI